jgi:hypothetical protein
METILHQEKPAGWGKRWVWKRSVAHMFESLSPAGVVAAALIALPGVEVIGALDPIDPALLSASAQVDLLVAWERQTAWLASPATKRKWLNDPPSPTNLCYPEDDSRYSRAA